MKVYAAVAWDAGTWLDIEMRFQDKDGNEYWYGLDLPKEKMVKLDEDKKEPDLFK